MISVNVISREKPYQTMAVMFIK